LPRLGRDERPGGTPPNGLAIHPSANSDFRKEIVATIFRKGRRGARGVACANAKADRRDAGAMRLRRRAPSKGGAARSRKSGADCGPRNSAVRILLHFCPGNVGLNFDKRLIY
jgi:hypothetical protein